MASPRKRRGKKLHGRFGKTQEAQSEEPTEPVVVPVIETPAAVETVEPIKKKRSFFSEDKE